MSAHTGDVQEFGIDALASDYVRVNAEIAELQDERERLAEQLRQLGFGTHRTGGGMNVSIQRNRRLSAENVQAVYPVASFPHLYKATLDIAALRRHVLEADLDAFYVDGVPRVVVRS